MGWRGTVRAIGAAQRRMEREAVRRQRELERQYHALSKLQERERAAVEVERYENLIERIRSVHKDCGPVWDWQSVRDTLPPAAPVRTSTREAAARAALASFRPGLLDKLLRRVDRRRAELTDAVSNGRKVDDAAHAQKTREHLAELGEWEEEHRLATRICAGDLASYIEAIEVVDPFSEISDLGTHVSFRVDDDGVLDVSLTVSSASAVPTEIKSLLQSGKLSVKKMPLGQSQELYQDYVCGAVLRVARELFALLPVDFAFVTAVGEVLDTTTGHLEKRPIVSIAAPRRTLDRLNFNGLDPSDGLTNFIHRMNFKKTKGFTAIERLGPADLRSAR